jgi:Copper type II ascorbate-dependent monooxygenase, N-terminal domain/Copper type II ascorbate-dependent monooxygenase, C-terminal domain
MKPWSSLIALSALIIAGGIVIASRNLLSTGETRPTHHHNTVSLERQHKIPPLLPYIPTYFKHVKPILERSCLGCHSANNIAPFSLETPEFAVLHSKEVRFAVMSKRMPPWMPGGDTPALRDEIKLSDEETAIIANWSWAGSPLGQPSEAAPTIKRPELRADLAFDTGHDFLPDQKLTDEYRCFVINPKLEKPRFMTGYEIVPGQPSLVHHVILYQISKESVAQLPQLEAKSDGRGGYSCFGSSGVVGGFPRIVGVWAPGVSTIHLPIGFGAPLLAEDQFVMQVHYNLSAAAQPDRTKIKLELAAENEAIKPLVGLPMVAPVEISCPGTYPSDPKDPCHRDAAYARASQSGNKTALGLGSTLFRQYYCNQAMPQFAVDNPTGFAQNSCTIGPFNFPSETKVKLGIYGALGHMHLLGSSFKAELVDQSTNKASTILEIPRWDFHWQGAYWLKKPIELPTGMSLRITCKYDNNAKNQPFVNNVQNKPRYVIWGEGTNDEMCFSMIQLGEI